MDKLKVINLWAGPGAGKSTLSSALFAQMKVEGLKVELVTEHAKDLLWAGHLETAHPLPILAEQYVRLHRLIGQVDYAVTDSPLPLCLAYCQASKHLTAYVWELFGQFDNRNVWVGREGIPYQPWGRKERTVEEAQTSDRWVQSHMRGVLPLTVHPAREGLRASVAKIMELYATE